MATFIGILVTAIFLAAGVRYIYDAMRPKPHKNGEWYDGDNWPKGH
jgi:hypothetical protein